MNFTKYKNYILGLIYLLTVLLTSCSNNTQNAPPFMLKNGCSCMISNEDLNNVTAFRFYALVEYVEQKNKPNGNN